MRAAPPHSLLFCFACHPDWTTTRRTVTTNQHPHHLRRFTTISFSFIVCNSQFPPVHNATPPLHQKPWSVNNTATRAGGRLSGKGRVVRPRPLSVFFFALIVGIGLTFGLPLKQQAPFTPFPGNNNHTCAYTHTHAPGIRFRFCAPAYPPPRCTIKWEKCLSHSMFRDTEPTHLSLRQYCFLFHPSRPIGLSYSSSTAVHPTSARDEGKTNPSRITPGVRTGTQHLLHLPPETKKAQVVRFGAARE